MTVTRNPRRKGRKVALTAAQRQAKRRAKLRPAAQLAGLLKAWNGTSADVQARFLATVRHPAARGFRGFDDFVPVYTAARLACAAVYGERWDLHPEAYVWARLPAPWVRVRITGGRTRWSTAPRDRKLPVARFWPSGRLPVGPEYAPSAPLALADAA